MREIKYLEALREGFAAGMRKDPDSFMAGEGIGARGGSFAHTKGLYEEFGPERVLDMPISESAFVGMCAGAAACGSRAIADLMYFDFITLAMDQIVNQAAKIRYISGGQFSMPMTINAIFGIYHSAGTHHSQTFYPWFINTPGIKVVIPSTPYDVKGLLASAIIDDNLVLVLEHRGLLNIKGEVPEEDYFLTLGEAKVVKEGTDVTIVATGLMVHQALKSAEVLAGKGVKAEIIDLRTLVPLDEKTVIDSVKKTHRLLIVDEGYGPCGVGAEITAVVQSKAFDFLDAPVSRLQTLSVPIPYSPPLEQYVIPDVDKIVSAVSDILGGL
ncbi:MAG: alpha-ketoacid dehydrogenase subunit beta [Candidatus Omnitrophota bacterium]